MSLVDILNELENGEAVDLVAKIESETPKTYTVRYLSPTTKMYGERAIYKYENVTYEVDKECVSGYYDSPDEEDAGFTKVDGGWVQAESDSDYLPSQSDTGTEDDDEESLVDENEED